MTDLLAARSQMAMSLAFHIVFAAVGMAMPLLMAVAEGMWLRTRDPVYLDLAKRWQRGTAILFAVGAVSGTVLSFELGLLWPGFMRHAGAVIGMPFSLEGFAFFLEAIFLGVHLYGWDRVGPRLHWLAGLGVAVTGVASGIFVVCANGWMNTPTGFRVENGKAVDIDVWAALLNPAAGSEALHMAIAAFQAVGWAVAGIHAWALLRRPAEPFHVKAFGIAFSVAAITALVQPLAGDLSAQQVARNQPTKLAALEAHWHTQRGAPLQIGGWPDETAEVTRWSIEIPNGLSLLAFHDPDAQVEGLTAVPRADRPPVAIVHVAFQIMVGLGSAMAAIALYACWLALRRRSWTASRPLLRVVAWAAPAGFVALEAGWVVTEVGRQPWIARGWLRTADAVTPMPHLIVPFLAFTALYCLLGVVVVVLMRRQVFASPGLAGRDVAGQEFADDT